MAHELHSASLSSLASIPHASQDEAVPTPGSLLQDVLPPVISGTPSAGRRPEAAPEDRLRTTFCCSLCTFLR